MNQHSRSKMSQKTTPYIHIPDSKMTDFDSEKREDSEEEPCRCSVTYRQDQLASNFRMVAIAIMMLFGFCVLLFVWNIVLWREVVQLHNHVTTLRKEVVSVTSSAIDCDRAISALQNNRENSNGRGHVREQMREETQKRKYEPALKRAKRSSSEVPDQSSLPAPISPFDLLTRMKRRAEKSGDGSGSSRKKKRGEKRKKGKGDRKVSNVRKKRQAPGYIRGRCRCPIPRIPPQVPAGPQKAAALHVKIQGTPPYRAAGGVIDKWDPNTIFNNNNSFDVSSINSRGVVIRTEGVYFIYSQVTFKMSEGIEVHEKIVTGMMGSSELTSCSNPIPQGNTSDYVTCYSSGIKHLRVGDVIKVKVVPSYLTVFASPTHTYFGAFKIGAYDGWS